MMMLLLLFKALEFQLLLRGKRHLGVALGSSSFVDSYVEAKISTLCQPSFNDDERRLFALPPKWGGLDIVNPQEHSSYQFSASTEITSPLLRLILQQSSIYTTEVTFEQFEAKHHVVSDHCQDIVNLQESLLPSLSSSFRDLLVYLLKWAPQAG